MERVHLDLKQVLIWPDEPITHAYVPIDGVVSLLALMDGEEVEAGITGSEGLVGVPLLLGTAAAHIRAVCQVAGDAWRLPADALREEMAQPGPLRERLLRYAQALFQQVAQTSGCNRAHPVQERCARWLLMVQDRVGTDTFQLTQEFLAQMLGVRRPSVTVVMGALQQAGLLRYHRGQVTILDRPRLEAAACECYGIIASASDRMLEGKRTPSPLEQVETSRDGFSIVGDGTPMADSLDEPADARGGGA
jgi:CRP-like cAMP-binding protein